MSVVGGPLPPPPGGGGRPAARDYFFVGIVVSLVGALAVGGSVAYLVLAASPRVCPGCPAVENLPVTFVFVNDSRVGADYTYLLEVVAVGADRSATYGVLTFGFTDVNSTPVDPTGGWNLTIDSGGATTTAAFSGGISSTLVAATLPVIAVGDRLSVATAATFLGGGTIAILANGPTWFGGVVLTVPYATPPVAVVSAK